MPVHHEKTERKTIPQEANPHRTKQREISVERRPIISQEKPSTSRQSVTAPRKEVKPDSKKTKNNIQPKPKIVPVTRPPVKTSTGASQKASVATKKISVRASNQKQGQKLPSKLPKSDYLNDVKKKPHDRSRTRTLSPSEVKILPEKIIEPVRTTDEAVAVHNQSEQSEETDYEDDFEDYESDFEEDDETETEEPNEPDPEAEHSPRKRILVSSAEERERKLDSGSYHISAVSHKKEIEEIKLAVQNENRLQQKKSVVEDADEGYLGEEKIVEAKPNILDFVAAGKRNKEQVNNDKVVKRGEELLKMITLDAITYTLLDISSVPYEEFMASYGRSDTTQVHVQTNEDACEEETQTDIIDVAEKWTQAPVKFSQSIQKDGSRLFNPSKEERLGVGGENVSTTVETYTRVNQTQLEIFLTKAAQKIIIWLEAQNSRIKDNKNQKSDLNCCDGMTILNNPTQKNEQSLVLLTTTRNHLILTAQKIKDSETLIKIWSILIPSTPIKELVCRQEVTTVCFGPGSGDLVFAGAADGSINLWDLRETNNHHSNEIGRCPTYSTTEILKETGHLWSVVSVIILTKEDNYDGFRPIQICSLDLSGQVIIWSVVQQITTYCLAPNTDLGLAPWGRVRLVKSSSFTVSDTALRDAICLKRFNTMASRGTTGNDILIGTNNGQIVHYLTDGSPAQPKCYEPSKNSRPTAVTTISIFLPDDRFFLVGCEDGTIRLYNTNQEKPLINLHWNLMDASPTSGIRALHWFPTKPCMFFACDATGRIHVWNLSVSDIYPQVTLPGSTQNPIISTSTLNPKTITQPGSIVLGRKNGIVELHSIKIEKDKTKAVSDWKKESKIFQRYVKIL